MLTNIITIKVNIVSKQRDLSTNQRSKHVTLAYDFETNKKCMTGQNENIYSRNAEI